MNAESSQRRTGFRPDCADQLSPAEKDLPLPTIPLVVLSSPFGAGFVSERPLLETASAKKMVFMIELNVSMS